MLLYKRILNLCTMIIIVKNLKRKDISRLLEIVQKRFPEKPVDEDLDLDSLIPYLSNNNLAGIAFNTYSIEVSFFIYFKNRLSDSPSAVMQEIDTLEVYLQNWNPDPDILSSEKVCELVQEFIDSDDGDRANTIQGTLITAAVKCTPNEKNLVEQIVTTILVDHGKRRFPSLINRMLPMLIY